RDGSIAVGPEHDARRRVRPLHGARPARRAAGSQSEGIAGLHGAEAVMGRMWAIIERELRRLRRSPALIVLSMVFPIVQLVVLGYAFGGNVKHLKVAVVDQDHGVPAGKVRELASAVSSGAPTDDRIGYRVPGQATLDVVEVYPYVPYVQYLLPGSVVMSIFMMVMIGGGIIFIDDKARGLHEGYLVTPISKFELIAGFNISGTIKAVMAGMF